MGVVAVTDLTEFENAWAAKALPCASKQSARCELLLPLPFDTIIIIISIDNSSEPQ